ncbi:uncharacterized protein LOC126783644 [Argentina anserina]|uniref:uncharacterized protein LOC126783644 n=1 Tax=Argentina anserina TaxID=57926 RepID=UPI0021767ADE|nr:uncharacterized protein LOC126783644 [Potentilla anserina]
MAGLVRTRTKRVIYPLDDKVKARLVGRESYSSSGSEHYSADDVSPCLSELVHSFLEEEEEEDSSSSESPLPRHDDDGDYDSDRLDSVSVRAGAVECVLRSSAANADPYAKVLVVDVAEAVEAFSSCMMRSDKSAMQRNVTSFLRGKGHNAAICKTKWSSAGGITAGHYEFIDVIANSSATWRKQSTSSNRYFVDVDFAAEFEIARPSSQYSQLSQSLPRHFVGCSDDLKRIVRVMCDVAKKSLRSRELSVPPWRKNRYMQNKWFGPYKRTVNSSPENLLTRASPLFPQGSGPKCRWIGFDDVVSDTSVVTGRVYIRT